MPHLPARARLVLYDFRGTAKDHDTTAYFWAHGIRWQVNTHAFQHDYGHPIRLTFRWHGYITRGTVKPAHVFLDTAALTSQMIDDMACLMEKGPIPPPDPYVIPAPYSKGLT